jgi:hypothetical protein
MTRDFIEKHLFTKIPVDSLSVFFTETSHNAIGVNLYSCLFVLLTGWYLVASKLAFLVLFYGIAIVLFYTSLHLTSNPEHVKVIYRRTTVAHTVLCVVQVIFAVSHLNTNGIMTVSMANGAMLNLFLLCCHLREFENIDVDDIFTIDQKTYLMPIFETYGVGCFFLSNLLSMTFIIAGFNGLIGISVLVAMIQLFIVRRN